MAPACDGALWCMAPAPEPGAIVWDNIGRYTAGQLFVLRVVAWVATLALCLLFIPLSGLVQTWTQPAKLVQLLPVLTSALSSPSSQALVAGTLPSLLLTLLAWLWPLLLKTVTVWQGAATLAEVDRGMCAKAFLFNVIIAFLASVLVGSVLGGLNEFTRNPARTPQLLAVKIPVQSRFFMNYVLFQGIGSSGPLIARWWQALQYWWKTEIPGKEETRWPPEAAPFGRLYPHILLQIQISIIFSTISPLMQPIALLYFLPALACAKTKMFWHHEKAYEGMGRMWPLVRTLVVGVLLVYQLTMVGLLGVKQAGAPTLVCALATILPTLAYARRMAGRYNASMAGVVPLEVRRSRRKPSGGR